MPETTFDLSSLAGLTLDSPKEAVEAIGGAVAVEPAEPAEPGESVNSVSAEPPQNQAITSVAIQAEQPATKKRGRGRPKKSEQSRTSIEPVNPSEEFPQPVAVSQESSELEITSGHQSPTAICNRATAFGFQIPPTVASSWMPQTLLNIANVISSWEDDLRQCNEWKPVVESARQGIPPLIACYENPTSQQIKAARKYGTTAAIIDDRSLRNQLNLYPPGSILARCWTEGFDAVGDPKKPKLSPVLKASTTNEFGEKSPAAVDSERQSAIDNILLQIFAEQDTIQSLKEEIDEHKSTAKELSETREEHVGKIGMLLDELRRVSRGE